MHGGKPLFPLAASRYAFPIDQKYVMNRTAVLYALTSAALFGLSTPAAKFLVGSIHPVTLAGLLYCGAGIGVAALRRIMPSVVTGAPETRLSRADLPWLTAAIAAGGILGPLLLMFGLTRTDAATASLLLTLEGVANCSDGVVHFPRELRPSYRNWDGQPSRGRRRTVVVRGTELSQYSGAARYRWCMCVVGAR